MQQISDALKNCDDETVQYTAGVGIMGTMYEDMGLDACTALLQTQGEISKTKDALAEINNQKYNDINSQIEELGRNIQTISILAPARGATFLMEVPFPQTSISILAPARGAT